MNESDHYEFNYSELLNECAECPDIYNKVSNALYKKFNIHSAELSLIITSILKEINHEA